MDRKKEVDDVYLPSLSNKLVIFIHGYTGSIHDFSDLPSTIHREFNTSVLVPLLPGHGTTINNLLDLTHHDLLQDIEKIIETSIQQGKKVVIIGLSFGAQASLYFASKYAISGIIAISTTHTLKFPFNIPGLSFLKFFKRTWKKHFSPREQMLREGTFYYKEMPTDGLSVSKKLRSLVEVSASHINQPVLFIHAKHERLANPHTITILSRLIRGQVSSHLIKNDTHNLFFSDAKDQVVNKVVSFLKETRLLDDNNVKETNIEKVSAIVPAYNEGSRIEAVLNTLSQTPSIDEIIVIDDGSTDDTFERAGNIKGVIRISQKQNKGKAISMDEGVKIAKNDIIFFCDADLVGFKSEHAEAIIAPVRDNKYNMYIGMRGNVMQRSVKAWGLNSGERALRKKIWHALPDFYKHGFRIEAGLNNYVKKQTEKGFGWKMFDYSQQLKETKYGIIRGTLYRWSMNIDVLATYFKDFFHKKS